MIQIIWPNGELTTGKTFAEVERAIRATQWQTYATRRDFREELAARAKVWSGIIVPIRKSSEDFIRSLHKANMFMMFVD